jgi:hypothetical protein
MFLCQVVVTAVSPPEQVLADKLKLLAAKRVSRLRVAGKRGRTDGRGKKGSAMEAQRTPLLLMTEVLLCHEKT